MAELVIVGMPPDEKWWAVKKSKPHLNLSDLLAWEKSLLGCVDLKELRSAERLDQAIDAMHASATRELARFLEDRWNGGAWAEVLLWVRGLPGVRPARFSRASIRRKNIPDHEYQEWLYNELFPIYYANYYGADRYISLSELHHKYGIPDDFHFRFVAPKVQSSPNIAFPSVRAFDIPIAIFSRNPIWVEELGELDEALRDCANRASGDKEQIDQLCRRLDDVLTAFVSEYSDRLFDAKQWENFAEEYDAILELSKGVGNEEKLRRSIAAGVVLIYILYVYRHSKQHTSPLAIYFFRSHPTAIEEDTLGHVGTSVVFVSSDPLGEEDIHGFRAICHLTQHIIAELTSREFFLRQAEEGALRAAAAGIVARNLSHNIGSHVIPRSSADHIAARVKKLAPKDTDYWVVTAALKNRLDKYIQQKAEFLAELSSEALGAAKSALLFRDVLLPFLEITPLVDSIAANEGLGYVAWETSTLKIRCVVNGEELLLFRNGGEDSSVPYGLAPPEDMGQFYLETLKIAHANSDPEIALPGAVGEFALYGILENLIRNAAKYSSRVEMKRDGDESDVASTVVPLVLTIELRNSEEQPEEFWSLWIYDNITNANAKVKMENGAEEYLWEKLSRLVKKSLITDERKMRDDAWGMAEIMIAANILAGIGGFKYDPNVLSVQPGVGSFKNGAESPCLAFRIRVPKVKKALLIGKGWWDSVKDNPNLQKSLLEDGVVVHSALSDFEARCKARVTPPGTHQFVIVDGRGGSGDCNLGAVRNAIPFRAICIGQHGQTSGDLVLENSPFDSGALMGADVSAILESAWREWLCWDRFTSSSAKTGGSVRGRIDLFLGQRKSEYPTSKWIECAQRFNERTKDFFIAIWSDEREGTTCFFGEEGLPARRRVVFDRHGGILSKIGEMGHDDAYVIFDKLSPDFGRIFHSQIPATADSPWLLPYQLLEAGFLRVLVMDERVAERALNPVGMTSRTSQDARKPAQQLVGKPGWEPLYWHVANAAGVTIVTHLFLKEGQMTRRKAKTDVQEASEGALHMESFARRMESVLRNPDQHPKMPCPEMIVDCSEKTVRIRRDPYGVYSGEAAEITAAGSHRFDVAIVHQGILDPLGVRAANELIDQLRAHVAPWVVIESGRGIPPQVRRGNEKFLPYSVVDTCLNGTRVGKWTMCQMLMDRTRFSGRENG